MLLEQGLAQTFSKLRDLRVELVTLSKCLWCHGGELFIEACVLIMVYVCHLLVLNNIQFERSQNTVLPASTQAVYKAPHSTVRKSVSSRQSVTGQTFEQQ